MKRSRLKSILYLFVGLLLIPTLVACVRSIGLVLSPVSIWLVSAWPVVLGGFSYFVFQWIFRKPMWTYVFGHELLHALAAMLSGARVKSFRVSSRGGKVVLTKSNLFVALAPYCLPLYTLFIVALLAIGNLYGDLSRFWTTFAFAIGFTFAFHLALTFYALRQHQPDLKYGGTFFSLTVIFLANCLVVVLLLNCLFPDRVSWQDFSQDVVYYTINGWFDMAEFILNKV